MHLDQETLYVLVGAVTLAFVVVAILLVQTPCRIAWQPASLRISQYETATVHVSFQRRSWALGRWQDVPATFLIRSDENPTYSVVSVRGSLFEKTDVFVLNITGTNPGTDSIRISATPPWHSQAFVSEMTIEVAALEGAARRIRQTAAALAAR